MPSFILQYGADILKVYDLGQSLTIGRLPDNTVVIDNPAVSGHHARVSWDGAHFVVEDLTSTNGTFVNDTRITRHQLRDGDAVLIGKHKLVFDQTSDGESTEPTGSGPAVASLHDTVYLDTKKHKELLSKMPPVLWPHERSGVVAPIRSKVPTPAARVMVGVLRVLSGKADQLEYRLDRHTSLIGKSDRATVRLQGWFKPAVAMVITRSEECYVATRLAGRTRLNNELFTGRQSLKTGDILSVGGLMLEFSIRPLTQESAGVPHAAGGHESRIADSA